MKPKTVCRATPGINQCAYDKTNVIRIENVGYDEIKDSIPFMI